MRTLPCTSRRTSTTTASTTAVIISAATAASSSRPFDHWLRNSVGSTVDLAPYRNATVARSLNETVNWITHPATKPFFTSGSQILRKVEVHVPRWTRAASSSSRLIWIMLEPMIWVPNGKPRTMCARIITVRVP